MSHARARLLYSYPEAADLLGLSLQALRDLVYRGRGPVQTRIGRRVMFSVGDLEAWISKHRQLPQPPHTSAVSPANRKRGRPSVAERQARAQPRA